MIFFAENIHSHAFAEHLLTSEIDISSVQIGWAEARLRWTGSWIGGAGARLLVGRFEAIDGQGRGRLW